MIASAAFLLFEDAPPCTPSSFDEGRAIVINEILADPPLNMPGDSNCDGTRNSSGDEFVEIYNYGSAAVDLSGAEIFDGVGSRHVFPGGTVLQPGDTVEVDVE